jgi:hypothetical protein
MVIIVVNKALQSVGYRIGETLANSKLISLQAKYHYMKIGVLSGGWSIGFYVFAS